MPTGKQIWKNIVGALGSPRLQLWVLILAGPALTALHIYEVQLLMDKKWGAVNYPLILEILKWSIRATDILLGIVIVALCAGLINGVKLSAAGVSVDVDLDNKDEPNV